MIDDLGEMPQTSLMTASHCSPGSSNVRSTGLACPNFSLTFVMGYTGYTGDAAASRIDARLFQVGLVSIGRRSAPMIGDPPTTDRFLTVCSAGSEMPEHRIQRPCGVRVGALYYIRTTHWTSIAKLDFTAQEFWALGAPWSHYVGIPLTHVRHAQGREPPIMWWRVWWYSLRPWHICVYNWALGSAVDSSPLPLAV